MNSLLPHHPRERGPAYAPLTKPTRLYLILSIFLLSVSASYEAEARLGETMKQCAKRYGSPTGSISIPNVIPDGVEFQRGDYSITCGFEHNQCVIMVVTRLAPMDPTLKSIPREDITIFMEANFRHTSWTLTQLNKDSSVWSTYDLEDHRPYVATYYHKLQMLTLEIASL